MNNEINKNTQIIESRAEQLAKRIEALVVDARMKIASTVNVAMVYTYFEVGRYIIEDEQGGKVRAEYGKGVLKRVSERLTERLSKGWSVDTLENARNFYNIYAKSEPVVRKSDVANVYAQQYALCLPDKALLQQKLREWIAEFKNKEDVK